MNPVLVQSSGSHSFLFFRHLRGYPSGVTGRRSLQENLAGWLDGAATGFASFDEAAVAVFQFQACENHAYGRYCNARGIDAADVRGWRDIPAVPTDAFKFRSHRLATFPAAAMVKQFLSSGTTSEIRGVHEFQNLALYESSIRGGWSQLGLPPIRNPWFLSQDPAAAPESSLVHMFGVLAAAALPAGASRWLIDAAGRVDAGRLRRAVDDGEAVELFGTAISLLRFAETSGGLCLPHGSWIFETGGYKGLAQAPEPGQFREKLASCFGVAGHRILNEYSMTELSSQFYRWPDEPAHRGPDWTRIRVVNPETGEPAATGDAGYLEIVDLANLDSVCAVRTQDIAIARGDSEFTLLGRDPGALPRGCSRASDDLLKRS